MSLSLDRAASGFKLSNQAANRSPKTSKWHDSNLASFRKWLEANDHPTLLAELTPNILREHLVSLQTDAPRYCDHPYKNFVSRPLAPRTIHGRYRCLAAFFNWAVREEMLTKSPLRNIAHPKVPKYLPKPFSEDEVKRLMKAAEAQPEETRMREIAILLFFLDTGVRKRELLNLQLDNVQLDSGQAMVMGKGAKQRNVYFATRTRRALWRYISLGRPEPRPNVKNLFLSFDGKTMKESRLAYVLNRLGGWAGWAMYIRTGFDERRLFSFYGMVAICLRCKRCWGMRRWIWCAAMWNWQTRI
jgi:site-specific recombinase XerD